MPVRSTRLGAASAAGGGGGTTATVFTVPANRVAIVKDLRVFVTANTSVAGGDLRLDILLSGVTARSVWRRTVGSTETGVMYPLNVADGSPWIVLLETDTLRLTVPSNVTAQCYASGALLDGDPV